MRFPAFNTATQYDHRRDATDFMTRARSHVCYCRYTFITLAHGMPHNRFKLDQMTISRTCHVYSL